MYRVGADIGGTFTDVVVALDDGSIVRDKALTTPDDYTRGVMQALRRVSAHTDASLETLLSETEAFVNGTTVVTNVIAELRGRRVGLLTTRGFEQQIRIHRGVRQVELDLQKDLPPPEIVDLRWVAKIDERVDRNGNVVVPLRLEQVKEEVKRLVQEEEVEALAICFLWSFRYPAHEQAAAAAIEEIYPDIFITKSSDIYPRIREYERMNTAVLNCFVSRGADAYIGELSRRLTEAGLGQGRVTFMQSIGGQLSPDEGRREPIQLIHSGPVGGVIAATHFAAEMGLSDVITADVGGTSFDTALIKGRRPTYAHRTKVNRLLTGLSSIDIHTIGAGGGSIAWIDERGVPQVGPRSAGSDPGPACYGKGGDEPTLTDVAVSLGLIDPLNFWGGALELDVGAARKAIGERIAEPLGRSIEDAAAGLFEIAVNNMSTAMVTVSLARGYDPRDFTCLAYGGAAGLFMAEVCQRLGIRRVILPPAAATFSAYGLLFSDSIRSYATTVEWLVDQGSLDEVNSAFEQLEEKAVSALREQGFTEGDITVVREGDLKYAGQAFEVPMDMPSHPLTEEDRRLVHDHFVEMYERLYGAGTAWRGFPIILHTARVVATGATRKPQLPRGNGARPRDAKAAQRGSREFVIGPGRKERAPVYDGPSMVTGMMLDGPAFVDDVDTTLLVPSGARLAIDTWRNYVVDPGNAR